MLRTDTHIHLDVYGRANIPPGIAHADDYRAWIPGREYNDILACIDAFGDDPRVAIGAAMHPWEIPQDETQALETFGRIAELARHPRIDFVGECGLDRLRVPPGTAAGRLGAVLFGLHVDLARQLDKALVIHCVRMHADAVRIVRERARGQVRGVVHAFAGSLEEAREWRRLDIVLGIGPIVLRSPRLAATVAALEEGDWVLETDAPHMSASGPRGTGLPDDLLAVADAVATLRGLAVADVFAHNAATAERVLGRAR